VAKVQVRPIDSELACPWILKKHYARRLPNIMYAFGMFIDANLTGVITYGSPASPSLTTGIAGPQNKHLVMELNRLIVEEGKPSMLISRSLRMIPGPRIVVSYADTEMSHIGYVYQASNWIYTGCSKERTDMLSEGHARHNKGDKTLRQHRSAKHRYVYLVGSQKEKKYLRKCMKYMPEPYPKGQVKHYDTGGNIPKQMLLI
jgi:hypothetical protein